ncbi:uncharacterized protein BT62DRAFT_937874 [Guyanagaster necrorhizus]|uniref:Uncharacterized protein n=1 Tax=Guyanagaster necrorhizus TaxID=856835 RepID=A0A9P8AME8_9AGAR|nr:uncharacterized protein BT62DRAFT_937874 [Guyanagaster necrorhizus MCA 3950]KAG7440616.1 hypothetical protein BT62DRAFT_937874 [Guyanagaster necrorhizus MCA 3950]
MGNITSLELRAVQLTFHEFSIFLGSPHLTHLKLAELVIAEYADPAANGEDGVDFSSPDCNLPQPQSALNRPVQDLRLDINTTSDVVVMDLVATSRYSIIAKDSLAKGFHDPYPFPTDSSEFDPLKFDTFKAVELRFGINPGDWQFPSEFQWWANSLSAVRVGAPLKELHLIITFQSHLNVNDLPEVAMPGWCNFDAALCGRNLALNYLAISIAAVQTLNAQEKSIVERWFFAWVPGIYEKYFAEGRGETAHLDVSSVLGGVYGTNDAVYRGDIHMY